MAIGAYIRVSSSRQRDQGDSPANQRERCAAAGATEFYEDLAVSGFLLEDRRRAEALTRLRRDIERRRLTRLIVTRLDRVARRDQIVLELAELCERHGVEFVSLGSGAVETSTAAGWLSVKMQLLLAEHFSRQLSENVRSGLQASRSRGEVPIGAACLPFHLAREPGTRLGVVPSARWAEGRRIIERVLAGESLTAIAREPGSPIRKASNLAKWLRSPALVGLHRGRAVWPALAAPAEQELVLQQLAVRRQRWGRTAAAPIWPLSGLCRCAACGRPLAHSNQRRADGSLRLRLRCTGANPCAGAAPALAIEFSLVTEYLGPFVEDLARRRLTPVATASEHPQAAEWRRELAFRREFATSGADHDRIRELELLLQARPPGANEPDPAKVAELALVLSDTSMRGWMGRAEEDRNADLRMFVKTLSVCVASRRIGEVRLRSQ